MIDIETLEREILHQCIVCGYFRTRFLAGKDKGGRAIAVDVEGRKWRDNKCPECINKYKTQWARRNYGKNAYRDKVRRILGKEAKHDD